VFWAIILGVVLAAWGFYSAMTDYKVVAEGSLEHHVNKQYRRSFRHRILSGTIFVIAVSGLVAITCLEGFGVFDLASIQLQRTVIPKWPSELDVMTPTEDAAVVRMHPQPTELKYRERLCVRNNLDTFPFDLSSAQDVHSFVIAKRPRFHWIQVESMSVVIDEFAEEPERPGQPAFKSAFVSKPNIYFTIIDNTVSPKKEFDAAYVDKLPSLPISNELILERPLIFIDDGRPSPFLLHIYAERPGLYTYHIKLSLRYLWRQQIWESPTLTCRFIKFAKDAQQVPLPPDEPPWERKKGTEPPDGA